MRVKKTDGRSTSLDPTVPRNQRGPRDSSHIRTLLYSMLDSNQHVECGDLHGKRCSARAKEPGITGSWRIRDSDLMNTHARTLFGLFVKSGVSRLSGLSWPPCG